MPNPNPEKVALDAYGIPDTDTNRAQLYVLMKALKIYVERNEERGDLWAQFDVADAGVHMRSKAARLLTSAQKGDSHGGEALDSALDSINYAAFAARHILGLAPVDIVEEV